MFGLWHEEDDDPQAELEESHRRVAIVAELRRPGRSPVGRPRSAVSKSRTKRKINASGRGEGFGQSSLVFMREYGEPPGLTMRTVAMMQVRTQSVMLCGDASQTRSTPLCDGVVPM